MSDSQARADTLIHPRWIVPVIPRGTVLEAHSLAITDGRISALLPRAEAAAIEADEVIELERMPFQRALEMVWSGEVSDAKSQLALLKAAHLVRKLE